MYEVQVMKRPKAGGNGKYRLAILKDSHGGRTDIFADSLPPQKGTVVDAVANVAASWNWRCTDTGVIADRGCPAGVADVLTNVIQGRRY